MRFWAIRGWLPVVDTGINDDMASCRILVGRQILFISLRDTTMYNIRPFQKCVWSPPGPEADHIGVSHLGLISFRFGAGGSVMYDTRRYDSCGDDE
jgi:hypothetical protein